MGGGCYSSRELSRPQRELGRLWRELGGPWRELGGFQRQRGRPLREMGGPQRQQERGAVSGPKAQLEAKMDQFKAQMIRGFTRLT